ncbi:MAG: hypothetical protein MZW92_46210 [Comamonadaceae bacterium]|nr:hypothetical protein [Comamonadaceae bacterium]
MAARPARVRQRLRHAVHGGRQAEGRLPHQLQRRGSAQGRARQRPEPHRRGGQGQGSTSRW